MGALAIFKNGGNGVPAARRGLIDLVEKIDRRSDELVKLQAGRRRLQDQLELVDGAKRELEAEVAKNSRALVDSVKNSLNWALSTFGGQKASRIAEGLAASSLQHEIATKTAGELDSEIERLEAELEALRAQKPAAIHAVMVEVASGYRSDLRDLASEMRGLITVLVALDQITAEPNGEFAPGRRVVVEIPSVGGMAAQTVAAPIAAVARAKEIWSEFALELDSDEMSTIESLRFPEVSGEEDSGRIIYSDLSPQERSRVDRLASQTHYHHTQGVNK
jgi:hypothetical protein